MRVDVNGVGTEFEVTGEGRPVLLLHGFPDSGRMWRNQVLALAAVGFRGHWMQLEQPDAVNALLLDFLPA